MSTKYLLTNCNIINGKAESEIIRSGAILIDSDSGNIDKIYKTGSSPDSSVREAHDLLGQWIMPGLINSHAHLIASGKPSIGDNSNTRLLLKFLASSAGRKLARSIIKKNIKNAVNAGVTTIRSLGDPLYLDIDVKKSISESKEAWPRLLTAGKLICASGGHGEMLTPLTADTPWEGRKAVRINDSHGSDVIKLISTGGVSDARKIGEAGTPHMTVEEISAICDEAHRRGLMVACHAESSRGVKDALLGGVDSIEHGAEFDSDMLKLFLNNPESLRGYTAYVPTLSAPVKIFENSAEIKDFDEIKLANAALVMEGQIKGFTQALEAGVLIGCGTDSGVPFVSHYDVWEELKLFIDRGDVSAAKAIEMATIDSAKILGIEEITGTIDEGKSADIIVCRENPLESIETLSNPAMVIAKGKLIKSPHVKPSF